MSDKKYSKNILPHFYGRASTPACRKGSITVEAAVAVPLFFLALVSLLYLMEMAAVRTSVRAGLQSAGRQLMKEAAVAAVLIPSKVEKDMVHAIGAERLERSIIEGGSAGLHCEGSYLSSKTGIGTLTVQYKVRLPIPVFGAPPVSCQESMRIKTWTGYEKSVFENDRDDIVYITETGTVYHRDENCTHLKLSVRMVQASDLMSLRNHSGGRYHPCEHCGNRAAGGVYITDYGDRYHGSLSCSGLKRTVYAVPISEAAGKGACSRCSRSGR